MSSNKTQEGGELQQQQQRVRTPNQLQKQQDQNCNCPTSLHTINESITRSYSQCPVCLSKFDTYEKLPIALKCSHTICLECGLLLIPTIKDGNDKINKSVCLVNYPLLSFLDYKIENPPASPNSSSSNNDHECAADEEDSLKYLCNIARLIKSHTVSRSIHRKTIVLINSIGGDHGRVLKSIKCLGERALVELTSSCAHVSHYHAQQQLWAAIRARACQFMGPAMQDEALRLVLLALEDGSALSRKVLVMFVVQRLGPQFPQASKTSVGHIVQLLYRASAFDVLKRQGNSSLMTLRPEFRNYEALRREHDTQIMKIGLEAGIRFTPEQWSSLLYGDTSQKPLMQSIIDKLQSPQTFQELLKEYLVSVQRLSTSDSQFLVSLHSHFKVLSMIDIGGVNDQQATSEEQHPLPPPQPQEQPLPTVLESLYAVLYGLIIFTANRKHQRSSNNSRGSNSTNTATTTHQQQQQQNNNNGTTPKFGNSIKNGIVNGGGVMIGNASNGGAGAVVIVGGGNNSGSETVIGSNNNLVGLMQANLCI